MTLKCIWKSNWVEKPRKKWEGGNKERKCAPTVRFFKTPNIISMKHFALGSRNQTSIINPCTQSTLGGATVQNKSGANLSFTFILGILKIAKFQK